MSRHARDRIAHPHRSLRVTDRAEQARDRVESVRKAEIDHVGAMEPDRGIALARERKQVFVEIDSFGIVPKTAHRVDMPSRAAFYIQQPAARRELMPRDYRMELRGLARVVLEAIDCVVKGCGFRVHAALPRRRLCSCASGAKAQTLRAPVSRLRGRGEAHPKLGSLDDLQLGAGRKERL